MFFQIIRNDITKVKADAIVNTANPNPVYGGGVDSAIYEAAGKRKLLAARKRIGIIEEGQAVCTPAFDLNARYIIHTVGPIWEDGLHGETDILANCYKNSLELAEQLGCTSIAFPLIAAGVYGFPKDKALQIALSVIQPFVMEHTMAVTLVVFDRHAFELSGKIVDDVREYVDANYVREAREREYAIDEMEANAAVYRKEMQMVRRRRRNHLKNPGGLFLNEALPKEAKPSKSAEITAASAELMPTELLAMSAESVLAAPEAMSVEAALAAPVTIDDLLAAPDKTFQEKLFEIIDERGLTGPEVYKNYISKQVYSKIQADKDYHPNKYTAIALCLSLHLNMDQTLDLMSRAGWTLSPSSKADLVVKGCILNKEYNVVKINCLLFDYECPMLEKIK